MARKSKTQKAKASAARQARKADRDNVEELETSESQSLAEKVEAAAYNTSSEKGSDEKSGGLFKRSEKKDDSKESDSSKKTDGGAVGNVKKRFQFFSDVRAELKRVTWPTRLDVLRWTGVVVTALLFFGIFTAVLDNFVVTPLLILVSGADPSTIDWFGFMGASGGEGSGA